MTYNELLTKHIEKLVGFLKDEDGLKEVMKRKMTKKEFKILTGIEMENKSLSELGSKLNMEEKDVEETLSKVIKKINQEMFKRELIQRD